MRAFRFIGLWILPFVLIVALLGEVRADESTAQLLLEGIEAVDAERPLLAKEKFKKVLEKDPSNYHALVRLGQLEMADLVSRGAGARSLEAERYFLLAAVAQPHRPEAYLGLAQMYYNMGYIETGDRYAKAAQNYDPISYEAFLLLGQRYEDSGNYLAAYDQFNHAFQVYGHDSYLIDKLYVAAYRGGLEPYKEISMIPGLLVRTQDYRKLEMLRSLAGEFPTAREDYKLPNFQFQYCPQARVPKKEYADLYEAFIRASASPARYGELRKKLDKIKQESLAAIADIQDPVAKARALYDFLKKNVLTKYDIKGGMLAEQVLDDKKYLCLSGSILYALIAQEAGLPVKGMITPGHAFAVMDEGTRKIQIEVTAEPMFGMTRSEGFDVNWWDQFKVLNRVDAYGGLLGGSSERNIGEVDTSQLTAYQFTNTMYHRMQEIQDKYKEQVKHTKILSEILMQENRDLHGQLQALKGKYPRDYLRMLSERMKLMEEFSRRSRKLRDEMRGITQEVEKELVTYQYDQGARMLEKARSLAPTNEEFVGTLEQIHTNMALLDSRPASNAQRDRRERLDELYMRYIQKAAEVVQEQRLGGKKSEFVEKLKRKVKSLKEELKQIQEEAKTEWKNERGFWLTALKRLETGLRELPCSRKLRRRFEAMCWQLAQLAEQQDDYDTLGEIVSLALNRIPESDFAKYYREQRLGTF